MKLFNHQVQALERTKGCNKVAYYHDMGLGKTFTGAEKLKLLNENVNLVICQKSKIKDWIEHFKTNYDFVVYDLTNKNEYNDFLFAKRYQRVIGVINYDLVFRRKELQKLNLIDFTMMLDESSMIQNSTAKRSKYVLKLKAKNVILLSGTPVGGKYENLLTQIKLLGWNISKRDYWNRYVNYEMVQYGFNGPLIPKITGYKNVDELKNNLKFFGADFLKTDEVLDLPEQNFTIVNVNVSKEYKQFMKYKCLILDDETELIGDNPLKSLLYSRILCGVYNREKLKAFQDLVDSTEDRLIVFYNFDKELQKLKSIISNRPISIVNGQVKDLNAYENENNSITFIQYQAGAMGLNLQKANKIIYYSLPLSSELYEQSKKRIHRIGQQQPCFYYILQCDKSVEVKILNTLQQRKDYTAKLFDKDF